MYDLSLEVEGLKSTALARKDTPPPARMKTTHRLRDEPTGLFSREASPCPQERPLPLTIAKAEVQDVKLQS